VLKVLKNEFAQPWFGPDASAGHPIWVVVGWSSTIRQGTSKVSDHE
jgi:hypothetical protein